MKSLVNKEQKFSNKVTKGIKIGVIMGAPRQHPDREWLRYFLIYMNTSKICGYINYKQAQNLSRMNVSDEITQKVIDYLNSIGIYRGIGTATDEEITKFLKLDFIFHNKFSVSDPDFFKRQFKLGIIPYKDIESTRSLLKQLNIKLNFEERNEKSMDVNFGFYSNRLCSCTNPG